MKSYADVLSAMRCPLCSSAIEPFEGRPSCSNNNCEFHLEHATDIPRKAEKPPKKLVQVWVEEAVVDALRDGNVDIPELLRRALREAAEKLE